MRERSLALLSVLLVPLFVGLGLGPGPGCLPAIESAHAQEALSAKDKNKARKLVKQADGHKRTGDRLNRRKRTNKARASYRKAAVAYREAYRITEAAPLLVELGAVHQARGELRFAARVYGKYLELEPDGRSADQARSALDEVESALAQARMAGAEPEPGDPELDPTDIIGPEPEPEVVPEDDPEEDTGDNVEEPADASEDMVESVPVTRDGRSGLFKWSGVGAGATGVALIGLGVFFGLDARSKANTLSNKTEPWTPEDRELIASGESSETRMYIFSSVGAALVIGGAVLFYRGLSQERAAARTRAANTRGSRASGRGSATIAPRIAPLIGRDGAGITLSGHF